MTNEKQATQEKTKATDNKAPRHHLRSKDGNKSKSGKRSPSRSKPPVKRSKVYRSNQRAFNECREAYPKVFSLTIVKPLAVGIRQQIVEDAKERGLPLTGGKVYNAIYWLTNTFEYKLALCKYKVRFDIHGNEVGEVTQEERDQAQLALKNLSPKSLKFQEIKRKKIVKHRRAIAAKENGEAPQERQHRVRKHRAPRLALSSEQNAKIEPSKSE